MDDSLLTAFGVFTLGVLVGGGAATGALLPRTMRRAPENGSPPWVRGLLDELAQARQQAARRDAAASAEAQKVAAGLDGVRDALARLGSTLAARGGASAEVTRPMPREAVARPMTQLAAERPARLTEADAVALWQRVVEEPGVLSPRSVRDTARALGFEVRALTPHEVGWPDDAPGLFLSDPTGNTWFLPDFSRTYASMEGYFDIPAGVARTDTIAGLVAPGRMERGRYERGRLG